MSKEKLIKLCKALEKGKKKKDADTALCKKILSKKSVC